jgi:pyruvate dehydrogenase E2 component (dihydrolipoamide acetyltransferase)
MTETKPLSRNRRAIAKAMTLSASIPQFTIEMTLEVDVLSRLRSEIDPPARPSYTDALVASVAQALRVHPSLNATFTSEGIIEHEEIGLALATALEDGLISPVISKADEQTILQLAAARGALVEAARAGALKPHELLSATFTISNLGPFGVRRFGALVVPPQAAILAVGSLEAKTIVLSLSVDHRAVDGVPAARFLRHVKDQLENAEWVSRLLAGERPSPLEAPDR